MPEKRGRKRRNRDRRPRDEAPAQAAAAPAPSRRASAARDPDVPSTTARATGFAIAVITVFLAILTLSDGVVTGGGEGAVRILIGAFLVLLGAVVGVLSLFPAQVRRRIRGA
jgi:hypothetical protein